MNMEWNARIATIKAMRAYGGSFVKALAQAWECADESNSARIEAAFPEYIEKYSKMTNAASVTDMLRAMPVVGFINVDDPGDPRNKGEEHDGAPLPEGKP